MEKTLRLLRNKYFIIAAVMIVWISFFDRYNLIRRFFRDGKEYRELVEERDYYAKKIEEVKKTKDELFSDQSKLEKFAREHYYMKKDNEDIFIVEKPASQLPVNSNQ
jgi:cell division protein FtsB